jgi:hypothetical protein
MGYRAIRNVTKLLPSIVVVTLALVFGPAGAALAQGGNAAKGTSEFTAQKKKKAAPKRAPTRIVVRRAYPYYLEASIYPRPDDVSWPGPNAVRECTSWLAQEHRPSGTVVVPRMRCWWQPK